MENTTSESTVTDTSATQTPAPEEVVPLKEFDRVKQDMHKFKTQLIEIQKQKEALELRVKKEAGDWESIAKTEQSKREEAEKRLQQTQQVVYKNYKLTALQQEAMKAGIRTEALEDLEMLDLEDVTVETTSTGRVNVSGVDRVVMKLKSTKPHWFGTGTPKVNATSPAATGPGDKITAEELTKLSMKALKSKDPADQKVYEQAVRKYKGLS